MIRERSSDAGFTLIELMVALVLLSAFMGGIYTVAIGSLKARNKIESTEAVYTAGPRILDLVEKDLRGIYVYGVKDMNCLTAQRQTMGGQSVTIVDMVTTTNSKVTVTLDNNRQVRSDVTEVGYRLRQGSNGYLQLYRREQFFFDSDLLHGGHYYLVYDRVISFTIDFFEKPGSGSSATSSTTSNLDQEQGLPAWNASQKKGLPQAARITVVLGPPATTQNQQPGSKAQYQFVRWVELPTAWDQKPTAPNAGSSGSGSNANGSKGNSPSGTNGSGSSGGSGG